jgi:integrase
MGTASSLHSKAFRVLHLVLDSGERLPTLVDATTWLPLRVALRWAVRYRRYRVQSSTLAGDLRILGRIYMWAWSVGGFDLDDFLTSGGILDARQIESLASYFRTVEEEECRGAEGINTEWFNHQLDIAEEFFKWALVNTNCGGPNMFASLDQAAAARIQFELLFESLHNGARPSQRIEPLTDEEITLIRKFIEPKQEAGGSWAFSGSVFSEETRLRNWVMFETALGLGLRRGELLKLRMDSIPRGKDDGVRVLRLPDDPRDSRRREPAVKTAERIIPAPRALLKALRAYITLPPPLGRVHGKSPYLFVTQDGNPVSLDTADDIISKIGLSSGVPLSWHRLRHTWAEKLAEEFFDTPNGLDMVMYLGGWTNPQSPKRYTKRVIERQAAEKRRAFHEAIESEDL